MSSIKIDLDHLEGQLEINKQLLSILEIYIKKAGEWSGPMIANMTIARESLETQQEVIQTLMQVNSLDNI